METMESLKSHVQTAEDLHSLVRTMKAMAAVNIRQLEHAVKSLAEYKRSIELGLTAVLGQRGRFRVEPRDRNRRALGTVVIGSDQGMCGQLNDQVVKTAIAHINDHSATSGRRATLAIGVRAATRLEDAGETLDATFPVASSPSGIIPLVQDVLLRMDTWSKEQGIDRIVVFFCEHSGKIAYSPARLELLPIDREWLRRMGRERWPAPGLPLFTMDTDQLFSSLVRQYLFVSLYRACAESLTSENASRLAAMRGAERNIGERIGELTRLFHQTRQRAVTEELLDIVAGFEALDTETETKKKQRCE